MGRRWVETSNISQRSRHHGGRSIADSFRFARSKVLTAKHAALLRLLRTVGGNLAKLNACTESATR